MNSYAGSYYDRHPGKFSEVTYGVDTDRFRPGPERAPGSEKVILFVGALIRQNYFKGLENLMLAFKRIRDSISCRLRVVGCGDMEEHYRSLADGLKIDAWVEFVTDADDRRLVECYQSCDLLVLPSTDMSEAFGIVLLEAMACAKPVVASNLPGVRSVFEDRKHGLLVEPGDVDDLTDKISMLMSDEETARRFGQAGRELVETRYTWTRTAEKLDAVYQHVTSKQS
jgi:glycosyltransferase involved in cell wall biosynthesis